MKGNVKWFDPRKGFGFIVGEDGNDYFVHFSNILADGFRTLRAEAEVEFEVLIEDDRRFAVDVKTV